MTHHVQGNAANGYRCRACGQSWKGIPVSACPGVPVFDSWEHAQAAGLFTKTQLETLRLVPKRGARCKGVKPHRKGYWRLFHRDDCEERPTDDRRLAAGKRAALTRRTCGECRTVQPTEGHLWTCRPCRPGGDGLGMAFAVANRTTAPRLCVPCYAKHWRDAEQERVEQRRVELVRHLAGPLVVIDVETTSLEEPEIVEIAVVASDGRVLLDKLVRPKGPCQEEARAVHGISDDELALAAPWSVVGDELVAVLEQAGNPVVAAWGDFDRYALASQRRHHGGPKIRLLTGQTIVGLPACDGFPYLNLMRTYAELHHRPPMNLADEDSDESFDEHVRLADAIVDCKVSIDGQRHRAATDARATLLVARALVAGDHCDLAPGPCKDDPSVHHGPRAWPATEAEESPS